MATPAAARGSSRCLQTPDAHVPGRRAPGYWPCTDVLDRRSSRRPVLFRRGFLCGHGCRDLAIPPRRRQLATEATWRTPHRTFVCRTRGREVDWLIGRRRRRRLLGTSPSWCDCWPLMRWSRRAMESGEQVNLSSIRCLGSAVQRPYPLHRILICAFLHDLHFAVDHTRVTHSTPLHSTVMIIHDACPRHKDEIHPSPS